MSNYVVFNKKELKVLIGNLQEAFNIYCGKAMKLTGYRDSKEYEKLKSAIKKTTGLEVRESFLRDLITLKHKGKFQQRTFKAIDKFISAYTRSPISFDEKTDFEPVKQKVFWSVNQGERAGVFINSFKGEFIEWKAVKEELEKKVITQCPRIIPVGSKVEMRDFYGKKNWVIWITDKAGSKIGSVWIGGDPYNFWFQDGLVRVGKSISDTEWVVYQVLQRYSDGSYRKVKSFV